MRLEGGCYCGEVRYLAQGEPMLKGQCHCRECQYGTGGAPNLFLLMPAAGFSFTRGTPRQFTRADLPAPVTREFCATCGTPLIIRLPSLPAVVVKVGTLDEPAAFGGPDVAIYTIDRQPFHEIPAGLPCFERLPPR